MQHLLFDIENYTSLFYKNFLKSELGQVFLTIPFRELAANFDKHQKKCPQGVKSKFTIEGGLGLMFLKHYTGLSDKKLIERVNTDWHYQLFCGLPCRVDHRIADKDMVGRWRRFFGTHMNIDALQSTLAQSWQLDIPHKHVNMQDATVYESYIKYPTDVKLLWDCIVWLHKKIIKLCRAHELRRPRNKYKEQRIKFISFSKKRKKNYNEERKRRCSLLKLLPKLLEQLQQILNRGGAVVEGFGDRHFNRIKTIRHILQQQRYHYDNPTKSIPQRIVSLFKPYIRPIVRGKENKRVEFGAKVNQIHVGGCNFIEKLDFEAFHEGNRFKKGIWKHQTMFGKVSQAAADGIYATNKNRKWSRLHQIATSFKPKGRQGVNKDQKNALRKTLSIIRGTVLEGSFGNEKNHYLLRKIRAGTQETEIAWIFFGVHTANAVKISKNRNARADPQQAGKKIA